MTLTAQTELNRLEDTDTTPPARVKHLTLTSMIAYAEAQGWKWFDYGNCHYRKDWQSGCWKGTVATVPTAALTAGEAGK